MRDAVRCRDIEAGLAAYADGEPTGLSPALIEAHLRRCPLCARRLRAHRWSSDAVREHTRYYPASDDLRQRVRAALAAAGTDPGFARDAGAAAGPAAAPSTRGAARRRWAALSIAAGLLLAVGGVAGYRRGLATSGAGTGDEEILSAHVRSLMADHLTDIASSDHHTVKPWFSGKLDFSPAVRDFGLEGYPLAGGRLDYVHGRPAAALVYTRGRHPINVFVLSAPGGRNLPASTSTYRGYQLVRWHRNGLDYWMISDLNRGELEALAHLIQQADSG